MSDFRLKNLVQILTSKTVTSNIFSQQKIFSCFKNKISISKRRTYLIIKVLCPFYFSFYVVCKYYKDTYLTFRILSSLCWTFVMICGIVIMWYSRKIREAMLCIRETWIVLISIITFGIIKGKIFSDFSFAPFIAIIISYYS